MASNILKKILHIDDDADIRTITKMSLETIGGYDVISCHSCKAALPELENYTPDFVLIDVMMPEIDGPETLDILRKQEKLKQTPIAFMTAKIMDSEIERLNKRDINGIIKKPFDPSDLCLQVQKIWDDHCS
jgi:CheY-like chemotaxis protein